MPVKVIIKFTYSPRLPPDVEAALRETYRRLLMPINTSKAPENVADNNAGASMGDKTDVCPKQ